MVTSEEALAVPDPESEGPHRVAPLDFEAFVRTERTRLQWVLTGIIGDARDVEDALQDAFKQAYRFWDVVGAYDKPAAWVTKVAVRILRRWAATERRDAQRLQEAGPNLLSRSKVNSPIERYETDTELYAAIRRLPRRQAEAVTLHYLLELSIKETAEALGVTAGCVKAHLFHGRRQLEVLLGEDHAGSSEGGGLS